MKKWIIALAGLGILWAIHPFRGIDAGSLCVVETLLIETEEGEISVASGELAGTGDTVQAALADMGEHTPGTLFLRQVRRVILCGGKYDTNVLMELPDEIPLGAMIYTSIETAESLRRQDTLDQVLEAGEQRNHTMPNLAEVRNHRLMAQKSGKAVG